MCVFARDVGAAALIINHKKILWLFISMSGNLG